MSPERNVPVLATGETVFFPDAVVALMVQQKKNLEALKRAEENSGWILALAQREDGEIRTAPEALCRIGVIGQIVESKSLKNGARQVVFRAHERFQATDVFESNGCLVATGAALLDKRDLDEATLSSLRQSLQSAAVEILEILPADTSDLVHHVNSLSDPAELSYKIAQYIGLPRGEAQAVLETVSLKARLLHLLEILVVRKDSLEVQSRIRETLSENIGKRQREVLLREQLKAIQEELGDVSEGASGDDYRKKIEDANLPAEARQVALREISRLERMGDQAAESHVIRNYLDLLCDMPWHVTSEKQIDLEHARAVLERDHYGLKKIKRRLLEHLAVMKLRPEKRGSILLFVGPPGVGKTSLGKSVAEALGREFVRVSLGGVRDDAEIRGHRRTYIGALPGRIIDGLRRAKAKDPVFVLDEVDKLAQGWGGDPSSALLEVLDPEQNFSFHDHYLDVPFDLSEVVFICTANTKDTVPGPLLDRMEVIELSGYTTEEKFQIARQHLLPAELKNHGLSSEQLVLEDENLQRLIEGYTREAGVRSLRRELAALCRAAAVRVASTASARVVADEAFIREALGTVRFEQEEMSVQTAPGVVTGMAWTPVGGDVLFVEAANVPGDGKVVMTGQLGDVMKESSQIGVALARSRLEGIAATVLYKDRDIHLHVPAGSIPKDGPSAGVTMFTAAASMMLGVAVDPKLAMTGEVTLRGKVLPVGGIKEKVLAAARFGVEQVILPQGNTKDLDEIPEEVRSSLKINFVSDVDQLLSSVFGPLAKHAHEVDAGLVDVANATSRTALHH